MAKNKNKKKNGTYFDLTTDSLKFKVHISQLIAKILLKQRHLNQIRHCLQDLFKSDITFFNLNNKKQNKKMLQ